MFNHDLDELLNILMPHAVERLCNTGRFQPMGAIVDNNGSITPSVAHIGGTAKPNRKQLEKMEQRYRKLAEARAIRAVGLCRPAHFSTTVNGANGKNSLAPASGAAIACCLEHANGDVIELYIPYELDTETQSVSFGELCALAHKPAFFLG